MLQAPSHLSRVCGHSHFKKSWLMKTQNDNQASIVCEKSVLASSSSRSVPSSSSKGSDDKRSPQLCERGSSMRSLLSGGAPSSRPTRPLVIGSVSIGATHSGGSGGSIVGSGKHLSLVTCAESLSPPTRADPNSRSFRQSSPEQSSLDLKIAKDILYEDDRSSFKSPPRAVSDVSATSSRCGSPSANPQRIDPADLAENIFFEREPLESGPTEPTQGQNTSFRVSALRSLLRARSAGLDVQESYSAQETDGSSRRGSGSWLKSQFLREDSIQKEFHSEDVRGNSNALLKKDSTSGKDLVDREILGSPGRNFTAEGLNLSQGVEEPCKMWMPFILKGGPDKSTTLVAMGGDDVLEEVAKTQSVNTIACEGANGRSTLRTCSICGTSKTPLWRSGPHGPKSLCNACGIRFKKSRRCPGSESSELQVSTPSLNKFSSRSLKRKQDKVTESQSSWHQGDEDETAVKSQIPQLHKRSRWPIFSLKKDGNGQVEDATGSSGESCVTWNVHCPSSGTPSPRKLYSHSSLITEEEKRGMVVDNKHSTVSRTYAKDEEEAAVLLMALSCGLVNA